MSNVFKIDGFNITPLDISLNENKGQIILQFDENNDVDMSAGTEILVSELDGNICILNVEDFRIHTLKCISILSKIDPLFGDLLNCEDADCEENDSCSAPAESGDKSKL
jgi:hypothetical protein